MAIIPKPPKKANHSEDKRKKYLDEWKELFSAIHPEIRVVHYYEEGFQKALSDDEKIFENVNFEGRLSMFARLFIFLPEELDMKYIVGLTDNQMFSRNEVLQDRFYWDNGPSYDCQPKTVKWVTMYHNLCSLCEDKKNEIVRPNLHEIEKEKIARAILDGDVVDKDGYKGCPKCGSRNITHDGRALDDCYILCNNCYFDISGNDGFALVCEWNEIDRISNQIKDEVEL